MAAMSFKRDIEHDRAKTREVLAGKSPTVDPGNPRAIWLASALRGDIAN
jgi:hypothetical protein